MTNERILSHKMSKKLTADEIKGVSASGTSVATAHGTYNSHGGTDVDVDINIDM